MSSLGDLIWGPLPHSTRLPSNIEEGAGFGPLSSAFPNPMDVFREEDAVELLERDAGARRRLLAVPHGGLGGLLTGGEARLTRQQAEVIGSAPQESTLCTFLV